MEIVVSIDDQLLRVMNDSGDVTVNYPISSALNGIGQKKSSGKTPLGRHEIAAKFGDGLPKGSVFRAREFTGEIYSAALAADQPGRDWILTRILWLSGLEPGKNQGGDCDSKSRYIYIHGTPYENEIGKPVSKGCLRMTNKDVLALYDLVGVGTSVTILRNFK